MARENITVDLRSAKKALDYLEVFRHKTVPYATRSATNTTAFDMQARYRKNARSELTLRNKGTEKSIQVDRARGLIISKQEARIGSTRDYMKAIEFGDTRHASGSEGVPIPTSYSANQGIKERPRTKTPIKRRRLANIRLSSNKVTADNRKQKNFLIVKMASQKGASKMVFMDLGRKKGIFHVRPPKRRPKVFMVHDLTERTVSNKPYGLLGEASHYGARRMPRNLIKAIRFQLSRARR